MGRGVAISIVVAALAMLAGCMAQFAPLYSPAITAELSSANSDIQSLFVAVGTDADVSTFASRKPAYDHIVAELNATALEIKARPTPNPEVLAAANKVLQRLKVAGMAPDPGFSDYPSARAVADLADTIQHMEGADQASGLHREVVPAFKQQATIYLTQAITYENFLKR
jgi:hypothetical protein